MRCSCCEKEIQENEKFYEIDDEFYCDDCVEEQTVTFTGLMVETSHIMKMK